MTKKTPQVMGGSHKEVNPEKKAVFSGFCFIFSSTNHNLLICGLDEYLSKIFYSIVFISFQDPLIKFPRIFGFLSNLYILALTSQHKNRRLFLLQQCLLYISFHTYLFLFSGTASPISIVQQTP